MNINEIYLVFQSIKLFWKRFFKMVPVMNICSLVPDLPLVKLKSLNFKE